MYTLRETTGTNPKHQRVTWPELYRKLIAFLRIVVWHMRVAIHLLEVMWLECGKCKSMLATHDLNAQEGEVQLHSCSTSLLRAWMVFCGLDFYSNRYAGWRVVCPRDTLNMTLTELINYYCIKPGYSRVNISMP